MKKYSIRIILATVSGILLGLSFPKFGSSWSAWIAVVPLCASIRGVSLKHASLLGFISGFITSLIIYYWVVVAILADGQSLILGIFALILLSAYLALYQAVFAVYVSWIQCRKLPCWILPIIIASCWVTLELIRSYALTGFPWMLLGYSQWENLALIQIASWGGVYAVSFLIVAFNIALYQAAEILPMDRRWPASVRLTMWSICIGCILLYGRNAIRTIDRMSHVREISCALLQGNIDQYRKWDTSYEDFIRQRYEQLAGVAYRSDPDIVIWPETSFPGWFEDRTMRDWLASVVSQDDAVHIIGAASNANGNFFNAAFVVQPDAVVAARYDKQHLVLFGETVPFSRFLSRWIDVLNKLGGFSAGKGPSVIRAGGHMLGITICFESIFPALVRQAVSKGAEIIINLTNDAWFLESSAAYQHFIMNVFRAVENRRSVVRCANTGISGFIDPAGRILSSSELFEDTVLTGRIPAMDVKSLYTHFGDLAGLCACVLAVIPLLCKISKKF